MSPVLLPVLSTSSSSSSGGLRKRKPHVYWHSKTHKTMFWMRTLKELRKRKPTFTVAKWLVRFYGLSLLPANEVEVAFCWRCCFAHAWWWAFSEICRLCSRKLSRCRMRLSTNFVGWKSGSESSHYQWSQVISCTFKCRVLLCSTKHLLVRWDVIATTDIHAHFFGVTFTVTASWQEQEREVRISATHVGLHWLQHGTSVQIRELQRVSYRFCPAWRFYETCHDVEIFLIFLHIVIHFVFRFGLLYFTRMRALS